MFCPPFPPLENFLRAPAGSDHKNKISVCMSRKKSSDDGKKRRKTIRKIKRIYRHSK